MVPLRFILAHRRFGNASFDCAMARSRALSGAVAAPSESKREYGGREVERHSAAAQHLDHDPTTEIGETWPRVLAR